MSEREIVCEDLNLAIDDLKRDGFRLDLIYPADDPHTAVLSHGGQQARVTTRPDAGPVPAELPPFVPEFVLTRTGGSSGHGRAGMLYRDLIPSRLGGRYIGSHIAIPGGGPVSDWVHYHRIAFQLIYVRRGWVRVVYEGQGEPFVMKAGDFVLQPPLIRHRVLESSPGLEVIEITAPAMHETFADHAMVLPNGVDEALMFGSQRFLRYIAAETPWTPFGGGEAQEAALAEATGGLADARTIRGGPIDFAPHDGELVFGFALDGKATLDYRECAELRPGDAFVIPPNEPWRLTDPSPDFRLLHVTTALLD
ncbi:MAG TPA: cupin domain-containing protein [Sphingomicrobium sp.]|nr:cupin domain-containing protein [Sphingomicrobium sp.]